MKGSNVLINRHRLQKHNILKDRPTCFTRICLLLILFMTLSCNKTKSFTKAAFHVISSSTCSSGKTHPESNDYSNKLAKQ